MPEIQIRPAMAADIPALAALDHDYVSDHVWQMDIDQPEEGQVAISFRAVQLPRSVHVTYPRDPAALVKEWKERSGVLAAVFQTELVGYISLVQNMAPATSWVTDLVVMRRMRRQGIGSALVLAAREWARQQGSYRLVLEMQPKNYPAICLAAKLCFDLCGYNDRYYTNHDIALFFGKSVR
jgi:GNAT superfamily N-acetyltransferase